MGSLWKELAARWLGGAGTTAELPPSVRAEARKQELGGGMLQGERSRTRAPSGVTGGLEDQSPEEALQPDAVGYRC